LLLLGWRIGIRPHLITTPQAEHKIDHSTIKGERSILPPGHRYRHEGGGVDHDETDATAIVQAAARRHQLRIAVQLAEGAAADPAEVAAQVRATLTDVPVRDLRVEPLFPEDLDGTEGYYLVVGSVEEEAGSVAYARKASEVSHLLQDTGAFARVEADIPVAAFEPPPEEVGAFGRDHGDNHLAGTEVRDWARRAVNCAEAWALEPDPGGARKGAGVRIGHPDSGYSDHFALGLAALDLTTDRDVISNDDDARDPLVPPDQSPWPTPNPGHGTGTGSVIAGRATSRMESWVSPRRPSWSRCVRSKVSCSCSTPMSPVPSTTPASVAVRSSP
jgi:hypothetical protein